MAQLSPLNDRHEALGAKLAGFGGWEMPLEYPTGVLREHSAVREHVGIFDVSHLGKLLVQGTGAAAYVDRCLTNSFARIVPGKAQYTLCCDAETGGIVDDLIAYLHADDRVLLVPNAANTAEVGRRLRDSAPDGVEVVDEHTSQVVLAVQGPESDRVLEAVGLPTGHDYMTFVAAPVAGREVVVCRTGYTGERGYELIAPAEVAHELWDALLAAPDAPVPCGLAARDTLRLEMGYPLHGQDITPQTTPVQAGLGWAVGWKKPEFWGRDELLAQKEGRSGHQVTVALRGLRARGRGIPRPGMSVRPASDVPVEATGTVGTITSGTFSPTLRIGIALALVDRDVEPGAEVSVDVRGRAETFEVVKPPFVETGVR